ncbi:MAG: ral nucleoside transport system permease protein, partial [Propionibacteriaceae bacterium]|nr:ral nucleoside transport system permease protein [Propionibacteriaceae bacterium]
MSTPSTVTPTTTGAEPAGSTAVTHYVESAEKRRQRLSTGVLVAVVGLLLLILLASTSGTARFALSDAFDAVQLPTVDVPGAPTVLVCGVLCLVAGAGFISGRLRGRLPALAGTVAGVAFLLGFLTWAAAGRDLPFPVSNQFAGTLTLATPLVFGALCGVLCERAGVVNVSIEGQFLSAAFAAAVVGSLTKSVPAALFAAVLAGVAMAALLALFSIKYLVNQVVLGVVLNLLAVGVTGFLFDQLVQPNSAKYNSAPVLEPVPIPGLSSIPFFGRVLFEQSVLAYLAALSVVVVWLLLFKTSWGLRVRAVGEHPHAADTVGISVTRVRWSAVLAGGIFAGLGGAFFTLAATGSF